MKEFTKKRATSNELEVRRLLQDHTGDTVHICENPYAAYDLFSNDGQNGYLYEVKERRQLWNELVIEVNKVDKIMNIAKGCSIYTIPYLVAFKEFITFI